MFGHFAKVRQHMKEASIQGILSMGTFVFFTIPTRAQENLSYYFGSPECDIAFTPSFWGINMASREGWVQSAIGYCKNRFLVHYSNGTQVVSPSAQRDFDQQYCGTPSGITSTFKSLIYDWVNFIDDKPSSAVFLSDQSIRDTTSFIAGSPFPSCLFTLNMEAQLDTFKDQDNIDIAEELAHSKTDIDQTLLILVGLQCGLVGLYCLFTWINDRIRYREIESLADYLLENGEESDEKKSDEAERMEAALENLPEAEHKLPDDSKIEMSVIVHEEQDSRNQLISSVTSEEAVENHQSQSLSFNNNNNNIVVAEQIFDEEEQPGLQSNLQKKLGDSREIQMNPASNVQDNKNSAEKDNKVFASQKKAAEKEHAVIPIGSAAATALFGLHAFSEPQASPVTSIFSVPKHRIR